MPIVLNEVSLEQLNHFEGHKEWNRNEVLEQNEPFEKGDEEHANVWQCKVVVDVAISRSMFGREDNIDQGRYSADGQLDQHDQYDVTIGLQLNFWLLYSRF